MMKYLFGMLVVTLVVAADDKKPDDDKAKLQGTWTVVGNTVDGKEVPPVLMHKWKFDGNKVFILLEAGPKPGNFKLDATQDPPHIDVSMDGTKVTMKWLYEIDGDTLKLYSGKVGDKGYPKSYDTAYGVTTLKREKK